MVGAIADLYPEHTENAEDDSSQDPMISNPLAKDIDTTHDH